MSRAVVLFLVVVAVAFASAYPNAHQASEECGPNEQFNACGSPCIDTCERKAPPICVMSCEIGCECKSGYVRNNDDKCVLTRDC